MYMHKQIHLIQLHTIFFQELFHNAETIEFIPKIKKGTCESLNPKQKINKNRHNPWRISSNSSQSHAM